MKKDNIRVKDYIGTWYVVDKTEWNGKRLYLLEHETYGDMSAGLIMDETGKIVLEDVWNGFEELDEYESFEEIEEIHYEYSEAPTANIF